MFAFFRVVVLPLLFLWGCGPAEDSVSPSTELVVQLPQRVSSKPDRLAALLSRVIRWEVYASKQGEKQILYSGPLDIHHSVEMPLPSFDVPYTVKIEVWDTNQEGYLRSFPILEGSRRVTKPPLESIGKILLKLRVSVGELDVGSGV